MAPCTNSTVDLRKADGSLRVLAAVLRNGNKDGKKYAAGALGIAPLGRPMVALEEPPIRPRTIAPAGKVRAKG